MTTFKLAVLIASGMALGATPAPALQTSVTQVDKSADGTMTYHFAIKLDQGETLSPAQGKMSADFVTIYNLFGFVENSAKSPPGWDFSSEEFGRTPMFNRYPLVLPVDVPNTPNLTWMVTKPVAAGGQIDGFTATTHVGTVQGENSAQATRQSQATTMPAGMTPVAGSSATGPDRPVADAKLSRRREVAKFG